MREINQRDLHGDRIETDVCVVGGGMAGLCAAIASARNGANTVLVHDRPVLGGNASSEVRMWICGAHGRHNKETGLLEEIQLENQYRNPTKDFSLWDTVLWAHAAHQPRLQLLLNTTCTDCRMEDGHMVAVEAWQMTTQTRLVIEAKHFIDCSGDSILAAASGALHRIGREARDEFDEPIAPVIGDDKTMGNTLLIQIQRTDEPQTFTAPDWAYRFESPEDFAHRLKGVNGHNFWWLELGGINDTIRDAEALRDDLYRTAYGVWDYLKNRAPEKDKTANWALHWLGSLPGKRESRRYVGDHILTQHDVAAGGVFDDVVAYGGWTMDDHHPAGLLYPGEPTIFHPAPSPYGIPFRSLYSKSIPNLFCAGRNISATHSALSSTRVMATCALLGQAAGTGAALCVKQGVGPRALHATHLSELQQTLMDDDCWLPGKLRTPSGLISRAQFTDDGSEMLRDGWERDREDAVHAWQTAPGGAVSCTWNEKMDVPGLRLVFDSDLNDGKKMACVYPVKSREHAMPKALVRDFRIETMTPGGAWETAFTATANRKRLVHVPLERRTRGVRVVLESTWGQRDPRLFSIDILRDGIDKIPTYSQGRRFRDIVADVSAEDLADPDCKTTGARSGPAA